MPKEFDDCVKNGGKVVTADAGKHHYIHGCQMKGGKMVWGERKKKKPEPKK